jgi:hypothetical protein
MFHDFVLQVLTVVRPSGHLPDFIYPAVNVKPPRRKTKRRADCSLSSAEHSSIPPVKSRGSIVIDFSSPCQRKFCRSLPPISKGWSPPHGSYQFNDGSNLADVIKLTDEFSHERQWWEALHNQPTPSAVNSKVTKLAGQYFLIKRPRLSARHRILVLDPTAPGQGVRPDWKTLSVTGRKEWRQWRLTVKKMTILKNLLLCKGSKCNGPKGDGGLAEIFEGKQNMILP